MEFDFEVVDFCELVEKKNSQEKNDVVMPPNDEQNEVAKHKNENKFRLAKPNNTNNFVVIFPRSPKAWYVMNENEWVRDYFEFE